MRKRHTVGGVLRQRKRQRKIYNGSAAPCAHVASTAAASCRAWAFGSAVALACGLRCPGPALADKTIVGPKFQLAYGVHPSQVSQSKREIQEQARSLFVGKRVPTGEHEFDQLCVELGIEHRWTKPRTPQTNGMVERFTGRISDVLQSHHFVSGEDLAQTLYRYVLLYNQQLPQSTLGSKTPLDAMQRWYENHPHLFVKRPCNLAGSDTYAATLTADF